MFGFSVESESRLSLGHTGGGFLKAMQSFVGTDDDKETASVDVFIVVNHSTTELPNVRRFVEEVVQNRIVVLWNLELETLRSDLGLFGFPSKDLHYDFLSQFKSVYFLRLRDYSKSITIAPFLINYSGALFREYPGPWQVNKTTQNAKTL